MRRLLFVAVLFTAFASVAPAQTIVINPSKSGEPPPQRAAEQVRVSLGISLFVAVPGDDGAQALKAQEEGRRLVYETAAHECEILRSTIAGECSLETVNVNVQRVAANPNMQRVEGYNINGSMNYRVTTR